MKTNNFTVADGLSIQFKDLAEWKRKLNKKTFRSLLAYCHDQNQKPMKSGYDVVRGQDLTSFILCS